MPRAPVVLIVSVDPVADTPASLRSFLRSVSLRGRGRYLLGPRRALQATWRRYGVRTPAGARAAFERAAPCC